MLNGTLTSRSLPLFGLALGLYIVAHFSLLLFAKRDLGPVGSDDR